MEVTNGLDMLSFGGFNKFLPGFNLMLLMFILSKGLGFKKKKKVKHMDVYSRADRSQSTSL